MMRRRSALIGLGAQALLLSGCATPPTSRVDPAFFPRGPVEPQARSPGRVALLVRPPVRDLEVRGGSGPAHQMIVPVGRIVGQALTLAAGDGFIGGAAQIETPAPAAAGYNATLSLERAWANYHSRMLWMVPLPWAVIGDMELDVQLAFETSLIDPQGQTVWTRSYDSGALIWAHERSQLGEAPEGLLRLSHQAAWQTAQKAVADLREWVLADRMRPREL